MGLVAVAHVATAAICLLLAVLRINGTLKTPWIQLASPLLIADGTTLLVLLGLVRASWTQKQKFGDTAGLLCGFVAVMLKLVGEVLVAMRLDESIDVRYLEAFSPLLAALLLVLLLQTCQLGSSRRSSD
jgi:hypothetical protein